MTTHNWVKVQLNNDNINVISSFEECTMCKCFRGIGLNKSVFRRVNDILGPVYQASEDCNEEVVREILSS